MTFNQRVTTPAGPGILFGKDGDRLLVMLRRPATPRKDGGQNQNTTETYAEWFDISEVTDA